VQRFGYVESSGFMNYRMISSVMQQPYFIRLFQRSARNWQDKTREQATNCLEKVSKSRALSTYPQVCVTWEALFDMSEYSTQQITSRVSRFEKFVFREKS
jgi:hypothetical protein